MADIQAGSIYYSVALKGLSALQSGMAAAKNAGKALADTFAKSPIGQAFEAGEAAVKSFVTVAQAAGDQIDQAISNGMAAAQSATKALVDTFARFNVGQVFEAAKAAVKSFVSVVQAAGSSAKTLVDVFAKSPIAKAFEIGKVAAKSFSSTVQAVGNAAKGIADTFAKSPIGQAAFAAGKAAVKSFVTVAQSTSQALKVAWEKTANDARALAGGRMGQVWVAVKSAAKSTGQALKTAWEKTANDAKALRNILKESWEKTKVDFQVLKNIIQSSAFGPLIKGLGSLSGHINQIGGAARAAFSSATGAMRGWLALADPEGMENLQVAVASLGIQLGRIFVPLLREVVGWLNRAVQWFKGLDDATRSNILHWAKIGLVVLGVLAILPKVIGMFQILGTVMRTAFTVGLGPLGIILFLLAGAIPLLQKLFGTGEGGGLGGVFAAIVPVIQSVVGIILNAFAPIVPIVQQVFGVIGGVVGQVMGMIGGIIQGLVPTFTAIFNTIGAVVSAVFGALAKILEPVIQLISGLMDVVQAVLVPVLDVINAVVEEVAATIMPVIQVLVDAFNAVVDVLRPVIQVVTNIVQTVASVLTPVFTMLASVVRGVVSVVGWVFRGLLSALRPVISFVETVLTPVFEFLGGVIRTVGNFFIRIINAIISAINNILYYIPGTSYIGGNINYQIAELGANAPQAGQRRQAQDTPTPAARQAQAAQNHRGTMRARPAEFQSIMDAWRKAMTAQSETAQERIQREQLQETQQIGRNVATIANRPPQGPPPPPFLPG